MKIHRSHPHVHMRSYRSNNKFWVRHMKAIWNGEMIAESDDTVVLENNHYFPVESVQRGFLKPSETKSYCGWKGEASYYSLVVGGDENKDAAWYYAEPKEAATTIKNRIAFWRGVTVVE